MAVAGLHLRLKLPELGMATEPIADFKQDLPDAVAANGGASSSCRQRGGHSAGNVLRVDADIGNGGAFPEYPPHDGAERPQAGSGLTGSADHLQGIRHIQAHCLPIRAGQAAAEQVADQRVML